MKNAAYELIDLFEEMRAITGTSPLKVLARVATDRDITIPKLLRRMGFLINRLDQMIEELGNVGMPVSHFFTINDSCAEAVFRLGTGWTDGNSQHPDNIFRPAQLEMLQGFAAYYDVASKQPRPNRVSIERFILELGPIADFVTSLEVTEESKRMVLLKIESAKALLADSDVQFDVILTKLGEIIGLLMLLVASLPEGETKVGAWQKVRNFTTKFGADMTVNMLSGATSDAIMGAIQS